MKLNRAALAVVLIVLGGAGGFLAAHLSGRTDRTVARVAQEPAPAPPAAAPRQEDQGSAAPAMPARHSIPADVPEISLADVAGVKHRLSEWKGHPLLINFWATWCEPCRREIPLLEQLRHERTAQGLQVIGIAVDFRDAVERYARDMGIDYPVLVGEQDGLDAIAAFGMDTLFPFSVFADSRGRIVTLKVGELHPKDVRYILDRVAAVDAGRIQLMEARQQITQGIADLAAQRARDAEVN